MAQTYPERLASALSDVDDTDFIKRVKTTVADELHDLDRRATVTFTRFFNHTYSPDLILTWPSVSSSAERNVYLRFLGDRSYIMEDLQIVGASRPIVFELPDPLDVEIPNGDEAASQLDEVAVASETLVTDPSGIQELIEQRSESVVIDLTGAAIAQGGKGLLEEPDAERLSSAVSKGFDAVRRLDREGAREGTEALIRVLNATYADRMVRFLQAVWIGSGGRADQFPAESPLGTRLSNEALEFLLAFEQNASPEFWRRVGHSITLEQLSALNAGLADSSNFQTFVRENLDRLSAKLCKVEPTQPVLSESAIHSYQWVLEENMLALRAPTFIAFLAVVHDQLGPIHRERDGISTGLLIERARRHNIPINGLEFSWRDRHLEYRSDSVPDIVNDDQMASLANAIGSHTPVTSCFARLRASADLQLDFEGLLARGRTAAQFPVERLIAVSLALFLDIARDELNQVLGERMGPDGQLLLDPRDG